MLIEQVDALKAWLTDKLSPICDAEPSTLAKYVCALVKKDKPEQELRDICLDQLEVFLQLKTKPFVDDLFEALKSKVYIPPGSANQPSRPVPVKAPPKEVVKDKPADDTKKKTDVISSTTDDKENKDAAAPITTQAPSSQSTTTSTTASSALKESKDGKWDTARDHRDGARATSREGRDLHSVRDRTSSRDRRDSWRDERNKEGREGIRDARDIIKEREIRGDRDTREVREPRDRDRDRDLRRRRTRSRSFSPRRRDYDDRRLRRFDTRYSPDRRWGRRRSWSRSPRRNRSPLDRGPRPRSRSPRLRSRSPRTDRLRSFRSRTRSRSPRPRSWSRSGSAGRHRSMSPSVARQPDSRGSTPTQDNDISTLISSSTNDLPAVTSTVGVRPVGDDSRLPILVGSRTANGRCRDFEEKGYCVLGDMCPYDHGSDPVIVEDVPNVVPNTSTAAGPPPLGGFVGPDLNVPPPGHISLRLGPRLPPPHVEPYLPEAPLMSGGPRPPFMPGQLPDLNRPPPGMNFNRPPPPGPFYPGGREVVNQPPLPDEPDLIELAGPVKDSGRIVLSSKRPYSAIEGDPTLGPPPPRMPHLAPQVYGGPEMPVKQQFQGPPPPMQQQPIRRGFDFNRLGNRGGMRPQGPRQPFRSGNLTLEVRKIPADMNNIAKLNEHFGQFGTLTNIQVKYQGDPGAALISFSNNGEATAAYRSPEPVFNNRFIKLFWHNPEKAAEFDMEKDSGADEAREITLQQTTRTGGRVGDGISHPSLMLPVRPSIPPAHKLHLDNTKPKTSEQEAVVTVASSSETGQTTEKSIVYTSSIGNLKKTVFNSAAAAESTASPIGPSPSKVKPPGASPTAVKTADYVSRMEAIKRAEEEKKIAAVKQAELDQKRQELLAKQIQQQKLLLETLEKKKATMSAEEKSSLFKALRTISDAIDKVKYKTGSKKPSAASYQAPPPAQLKYVSQDQAAAAAPPFGRGRGWAGGRGGWRGRGSWNSGPVVSRTHLDNRPKTLEVKGFELSELDEVKAHFQKFGEIEKTDVVDDVPSAFFTFSSRPAAEMAIAQGGLFKKKNLIVRWNQVTPKITRSESTQSSLLDDDMSITLGSIDEDTLLAMSGDERSAPPTPASVTNQELSRSVVKSGEETPAIGDSNSVVDDNTAPAPSTTSGKSLYPKDVGDDLLAGDEHFKASYTDDEDEEDHITVTLSNVSADNPTVYNSSVDYTTAEGAGEGEEGEEQGEDAGTQEEEEEDLADLSHIEDTAIEFADEPWS